MAEEEGKETNPEQESVEEQTLTVEEQLKTLEAEVGKHKAFADEKDKGFKSIQQELSKAKNKLQHLEGEKSELSSLSAKLEVLGGIVSEYLERQGEASLEEMPPTKRIDLSKRFQEAGEKAIAKDEMARAKIEIEPRQHRAEALGIPLTDQRIRFVEYLTTTGQYDEADKALDALEAELKEPKKEEEPEMTEEEKTEKYKKDVEEVARKMLEEQGLLKTETGIPSGGGTKKTYKLSELADVEEEISKLPIEQRKLARKDLKDAFKEGRIFNK